MVKFFVDLYTGLTKNNERYERYVFMINTNGTDYHLSYREFVHYFLKHLKFRIFFYKLLRNSLFKYYYWECVNSKSHSFQFSLIETSPFHQGNPNKFKEHMINKVHEDCISFISRNRHTMLIVPIKKTHHNIYSDIATFIRSSHLKQIECVFITTFTYVDLARNHKIWLSTSGREVPWLHIRICGKPHHYKFEEYKHANIEEVN